MLLSWFVYLTHCVCMCLCVTCSDQFARAFHKGSRPGSALSGNVPSPIGHLQEPQYNSYADEQFYKGPQIMPGQDQQMSILIKDRLFHDTEWRIIVCSRISELNRSHFG